MTAPSTIPSSLSGIGAAAAAKWPKPLTCKQQQHSSRRQRARGAAREPLDRGVGSCSLLLSVSNQTQAHARIQQQQQPADRLVTQPTTTTTTLKPKTTPATTKHTPKHTRLSLALAACVATASLLLTLCMFVFVAEALPTASMAAAAGGLAKSANAARRLDHYNTQLHAHRNNNNNNNNYNLIIPTNNTNNQHQQPLASAQQQQAHQTHDNNNNTSGGAKQPQRVQRQRGGGGGSPRTSHNGKGIFKRSFVGLGCLGVYDKAKFARLDKVCEDCYQLYREPDVHSACRTDCFRNNIFNACVDALLLSSDQAKLNEMVDELYGK